MARYIVRAVSPDGRTIPIVVVLSPDQLCSGLVEKIKSRLQGSDPGCDLSGSSIALHLGSLDGPSIDSEDLLGDALEPKDVVYTVIGGAGLGETNKDLLQIDSLPASGKPLRVRVITPELARSQPNVDSIPLLPESSVTYKTTLAELQSQVKQHLGLGSGNTVPFPDSRCNCSFARQIDLNATFDDDSKALRTLIVVCDNNRVVCLPVNEPTQTCLKQTVMYVAPRLATASSMQEYKPTHFTSPLPFQKITTFLTLPLDTTWRTRQPAKR
jgi:hypothetical protein